MAIHADRSGAVDPWPADHPVPVAGVILDGGDEILLVRDKRLDEFWLVSGWLEAWESAEDAAIREVREEVGLHITDPMIVGSYSCQSIGRNLVLIVYAAQVARTAQVVIGDEIAETRWFRKDQLPAWPSDSPAATAVADYLGRDADERAAGGGLPVSEGDPLDRHAGALTGVYRRGELDELRNE